ncbi:MAG TPA: hypothetical protein VFN67_38630 [Polyangiales bacterium]|nr:hypothetical protein [Polyangiales bacterium]
METWPTNNSQESNDAVALPAPPSLPVVYRVYDNEQTASRAAQLLVEAGFPPQHVYVGVEREGQLRRAYTGRAIRLGIAVSLGAAVSCTIGTLLATSSAVGLTSFPLGPLSGLSAVSVSTLSLIPSAIPGLLLGWLVAAVLWRRGAPNFPVQNARKPTFVGVEVNPGNMLNAELSLMHAHSAVLARPADWPKLAAGALANAA